MKQTANAIKFLMAQYRAIFKQAYIKGLVTAVTLTTGLAASGAATAENNFSGANFDNLTTDISIVATGGDGKTTFDKLTVEASGSDFKLENTITVKSGSTADNYIKNATDKDLTLKGAGGIVIATDGADADKGMTISNEASGGNGKINTVSLKTISVDNGNLLVQSSGSTVTAESKLNVSAEQITVGGKSTTQKAVFEIKNAAANAAGAGASYQGELGESTPIKNDITIGAAATATTAGTAIVVGGKGTLKITNATGNSGSVNILGDSLTVQSGGLIHVADGTANTIASSTFKLDPDGTTIIDAGKGLNFTGHEADIKGNLLVAGALTLSPVYDEGATSDPVFDKPDEYNKNTDDTIGSVSFASGSNIQLSGSGSITLNKGTLTVDDKAGLYTAAEGSGAITIDGQGKNFLTDDEVGTLKISSGKLKAFLKGGEDYKAIKNDGTLDNAAKSAAGRLVLKSGSVLHFTDKETVDLADAALDFTHSDNGDSPAPEAGKITTVGNTGSVSDNTTFYQNAVAVKAESLQVSSKTDGLSNVSLLADTIILGSDKFNSKSDKLGFYEANAANFEFRHNSSEPFTLKDSLFYIGRESVENPFNKNQKITVAASGTISSALKVTDTTFRISNGNYTDAHSFELDKGELRLRQPDDLFKTVDSVLTLTDAFILNNTSGANSITIDGQFANPYGETLYLGKDINGRDIVRRARNVLDISNATLTIKEGEHLSTFSVAYGDLVVSDSQLADILNLNGARNNKSGSSILLDSESTLTVIGRVEDPKGGKGVDVSKFVSGSEATATDKIYFKSTATNGTATLAADSIWLTSTESNSLDIDRGHLKAARFTLDNTTDAGKSKKPFLIKSGHLTVTESLGSTHNNLIDLGNAQGDVSLTLGEVTPVMDDFNVATGKYEITTAGTVATDLKLNGQNADESKIDVLAGKWGAKGIEVTKGSITVGSASTYYVNLEDVRVPAELNASKVTLSGSAATDSNLTVNTNGKAVFDEFYLNNGTVTVLGSLTVNGKYTAAGKEGDASAESFGALISGGSVSVSGRNASLTFGNDVLKKISTNVAKGDASTVTGVDSVFKGAVISVDDFATLNLNFDNSITFDADSIKALRKSLLSSSVSADGAALKDGYIDLGDAKIKGLNVSDNKISWKDYGSLTDIKDVVTNELKNATLIDVTSDALITGANVANIQTDYKTTGQVKLGDVTLHNANANNTTGNFLANADGKLIGAQIQNGAHVTLNNGGNIGHIEILGQDGNDQDNRTVLNIVSAGDAKTVIDSIDAKSGNSEVSVYGNTEVLKSASVGDLDVASTLTVNKSLTVSGDLFSGIEHKDAAVNVAEKLAVKGDTEFHGKLSVTGDASFGADDGKSETVLGGVSDFKKDLSVKGSAEFTGLTTVAGKASLNSFVDITDGGMLEVKDTLIFNKDGILSLGEDAGKFQDEEWSDSNGYLNAKYVDLKGGTIMADPDFDKAASIAAIGGLGNKDTYKATLGNAGGTLEGDLVALRNGVIAVGVEGTEGTSAIDRVRKDLAPLFVATGALDKDNAGAVVYISKAINVTGDSRIIADSSKSKTSYLNELRGLPGGEYAQKVNGNHSVYLSDGSALVIGDTATDVKADNKIRASVFFDRNNASILTDGGKVLLAGSTFNTRSQVFLFDDKDGDGILVAGEEGKNDLHVESLNGLFTLTYKAGEKTVAKNLELNGTKLPYIFNSASTPVRNTLISYSARDNNWAFRKNADGTVNENYKADLVVDGINTSVLTDDGKTFYTLGANGQKTPVENNKDYVAVSHTETGDAGSVTKYTVYDAAYNDFLERVVMDSRSGIEADQVARLAAFGGTAQAALSASTAATDAIAGRLGMGAAAGNITFADNGQGSGMWISPVYRNHDSDGFKAQGLNYGVDMDLTGVAIGGDFTTSSGIRFGAAFNIGTGDAEGQGAGAGVKNDFNYAGFALYGGYSAGALSVIGDVSYTVVDNDLEANTAIDKVKTSADSKALSVGVTGQYAFDFSGISVVPHAGLRYTSIDIDDFSYTGDATGKIGEYKGDSLNIFSIPVGVTVSKDIVAGSWTVKPALDLTLTANTGDDSVDGTVHWSGTSNLKTAVQSEVVDSFTYGATIGVSAKSGNISFGAGLNYTGSSNADEFGVNANARFVF